MSAYAGVIMVIVLAGRRVDAPNAREPRFPAENLGVVKERIRDLLKRQHTTILICSAACGADLLALEAATELDIRKAVVLPYPRDVFRRTSVVDRPGNWGESYDRVIRDVESKNDLVVLAYAEDDPAAYSGTSRAILEHGEKIARQANLPMAAVVIWDGKSKDKNDFTQQFQNAAESRRINIIQVSTLR